ncbi:MAG: HAD family phosphatase [Pirellulales bacterium]|nr:HAD family phosphatase [Pirellulales bacterium]
MPLRAVAFDMDGLMFNSEDVYTEVGAELMRRRGRAFTPDLKDAMLGLPPRESFKVMIDWHGLDEDWEEMAKESDGIFLDLLDDRLAVMPGLCDLLGTLESAGIPKAVTTSSGPRLTEAVLGKFDLRRRFAFVLTSQDITHGKPDPEIYLLAARRLGVAPAELMVLEDSHYGVTSAWRAGAYAVAVPNEHTAAHDFGAAALVARSLADPRIRQALGLPG